MHYNIPSSFQIRDDIDKELATAQENCAAGIKVLEERKGNA